jgi:hypothetical protein
VTLEQIPPPTISINGAPDQSFFLCTPETICLPYTAADGMGGGEYSVSIVSGPGNVDSRNDLICFFAEGPMDAIIIVEVTDPCGSSRDTINVEVTMNSSPICNLPGDTAITICDSAEVCLPVSGSDVDGNFVECRIVSGPGVLANGLWCFTPTQSGPVTVTIECLDQCAVEDNGDLPVNTGRCQGSFTVNFDVQGAPPVCNFPNDTTILLCAAGQVCLPFSSTDPEGGEITCTQIEGPGQLIGNTWCYDVQVDQEVTVTIRCSDGCGQTCEGTFTVLFDINDAPTLNVPESVNRTICGVEEVCVPISFDDPNNNLALCEVLEGPGAIVGSDWCWTPPQGDRTVDVKIRCVDECGLTRQKWMRVIIDYNGRPFCVLPSNRTFVLCAPGELCLDIQANNINAEGVTCILQDGVGEIRGVQWCYDVTQNETFDVSIRCSNVCGDVCVVNRTYTVVIDPNECDTGPANATQAPTYKIVGDLDGSGEINVVDLVRLMRLVHGQPGRASVTSANVQFSRLADVTCDGAVDETDIAALAAYLFGGQDLPCSDSAANGGQ